MEIDTQHFQPTLHWFVPLNELDATAGAPLRPADLKPAAAEQLADQGDSLLITMESLLIVKKYDSKSDNDLLVRSRVKYGNERMVEAINFFENDVPAGAVRNNLLCEYIYARKQYSKLDRIHLEVEVMELPGDISLNKDISKGLSVIKSAFGAVLSSFLPFGGVAFDVMKKVNTVRSDKRRIFSSALDLYGEGGEGEARLRYGAYIFFQEPVDGRNYRLQNLQVIPHTSEESVPYDYIVVKVVPNPIRVGSNEELALNNQKLGAVLGTADGQMDNNAHHPNFGQFVSDTDKLRKLALFFSLQKRKDTQETLDTQQASLYQKLSQELREFV